MISLKDIKQHKKYVLKEDVISGNMCFYNKFFLVKKCCVMLIFYKLISYIEKNISEGLRDWVKDRSGFLYQIVPRK